MTNFTGTIEDLTQVPGSGLATLEVRRINDDGSEGTIELIHGDHRPLLNLVSDLGIGAEIEVVYDDDSFFPTIIAN